MSSFDIVYLIFGVVFYTEKTSKIERENKKIKKMRGYFLPLLLPLLFAAIKPTFLPGCACLETVVERGGL